MIPPAAGVSISRDGHTAIVQAGAARDANAMVVAADRLKGKLSALSGAGVQVHLTGASAMWSDFNAANRSAMLKSEVVSWPVTLVILLLAFGSLVAAGLPLMLTMVGLMAAAGSLYLTTKIMPVSIWAMNFALMFALALGIDYALFIVHRFRGAFFGSTLSAEEATAVTMDTAGKAVLFSGVTVLISLSAVMLVPSPAFRSMSLGIMLAVLFVLAATLTLLPAVLAKLGPRVDKLALPWAHSGEHRSARFAAWGERLWKRPLAYGAIALAILVALAIPVTQLKTAMPSIKVVPTSDSSRIGYQQVQAAMGPGSTGPLQIVTLREPGHPGRPDRPARSGRRGGDAGADVRRLRADHGDPQAGPVQPGRRPDDRPPPRRAPVRFVDRWRGRREPRPPERAVGQDPARDRRRPRARVPAAADRLQAPLLAAVGVLTNLLATGAAFGVAKLVFQNGDLHSLLGFQPQGFLDAWGPVFFFAMIFAISMDYTVFLLSSAKEHWDRTHDPKEAMVGGLAHSGRVIFAAGAVMVAVFLTFALSGPAAAKGDGNHPRRRRAPRRGTRPAAAAARAVAADGQMGVVSPALGASRAPRGLLRTRMSGRR